MRTLVGFIGTRGTSKAARPIGALCVAVGMFVGGTVSAAASGRSGYNAVSQFSVARNPSGPWSYLLDGEHFTHTGSRSAASPECPCWWNGNQYASSAIIGANRGASTLHYETIVLPAGYIDLDPESTGNVGLRWTAPVTGTFTVSGRFVGVDVDEADHMVGVYHDGAPLYSESMSKYGQRAPFDLTVHAVKGDTVDFVSWSNGPSYLSTGLQVVIRLE